MTKCHASFLLYSYLLCVLCFLNLCGCVFPWFMEVFFYDFFEDLLYASDLGYSPPSFLSLIQRFGFFMVPQISCMFLSCF